MMAGKKLWRWVLLTWSVVSISLVSTYPVSAVPYVTPSDPSYRGLSRQLLQDAVAHGATSDESILICYADALSDRGAVSGGETRQALKRFEQGLRRVLHLWSADALP